MISQSNCRHLNDDSLQNFYRTRSLKKESDTCICTGCGFAGKNLWLCLDARCTFLGCGEKQQDCSSAHFQEKQHPVVVNVASRRLWCYLCEREVGVSAGSDSTKFDETCASEKLSHASPNHHCSEKLKTCDSQKSKHSNSCGESCKHSQPNFRPLFYETEKIGGRVGLRNLGNTCYLNAAIQALSNCPSFSRYFVDLHRLIPVDSDDANSYDRIGQIGVGGVSSSGKQSTRLAANLCDVFGQLWSSKSVAGGAPVVPHSFVREFHFAFSSFRMGNQQDAQEFLRCLLDRVHEEMKVPVGLNSISLQSFQESQSNLGSPTANHSDQKETTRRSDADSDSAYATNSSTSTLRRSEDQSADSADNPTSSSPSRSKSRVTYRSIVSDVFEGKLLSTVRCLACGHVSNKVESFMDLSLPIPLYSVAKRKKAASRLQAAGTADEEAKKRTEIGQAADLQRFSNLSQLDANKIRPSGNRGQFISRFFSIFSLSNLLFSTYRAAVWFYSSWIRGLFDSTTIGLHDCFDAFFRADELKDDNRYYCERCRAHCNGLKYAQLLRLPDVLCVHLKRFRHDFSLSTKICNYVDFPLDSLEMRQYLHSDCRDAVTSYDLVAVVMHHGNAGGGHYTARAINMCDGEWYEFDDSSVERVDAVSVQQADAYILFYKKKDDQMVVIRDELSQLLELQNRISERGSSMLRFYIAREWLHRFAYFSEPGPPDNSQLVCPHGAVHPRCNSAKLPIYDRVIQVSPAIWSFLRSRFAPDIDYDSQSDEETARKPQPLLSPAAETSSLLGNVLTAAVTGKTGRMTVGGYACGYGSLVGPAITHLSVCEKCELMEKRLAERRLQEQREFKRHFERLSYALRDPSCSTYAINSKWLQSWELFALGKSSEAPGSINNAAIAVRLPRSIKSAGTDGQPENHLYVLNPNADYFEASEELWHFFQERYGGGPQICVRKARVGASSGSSNQFVNSYLD